MSRVRGYQPMIEFLDNKADNGSDSEIPDEPVEDLDASPAQPIASTSKDFSSEKNKPNKLKKPGALSQYIKCLCGKRRHKNKMVCDFCGYDLSTRLSLSWDSIKMRAPKSPSYTTKKLFDRVFQLYAAHDRDVLVLIHCKDGQGEKFRQYATPGRAELFVSGKLGEAIKSAWASVNHPEFEIERNSMLTENRKRKFSNVIVQGKRPKVTVKKSDKSSDSSSTDEEESEVYKVDKVLQKRTSATGEMEYLVKWRGWSNDYNSWEPERNIIDKTLIEGL